MLIIHFLFQSAFKNHFCYTQNDCATTCSAYAHYEISIILKKILSFSTELNTNSLEREECNDW